MGVCVCICVCIYVCMRALLSAFKIKVLSMWATFTYNYTYIYLYHLLITPMSKTCETEDNIYLVDHLVLVCSCVLVIVAEHNIEH